MLGTAARSSVTKDRGVPIRGGAISDIKIAIAKLIGTPMAIAIAELSRVPIMNGKAPKASRPSTAFQFDCRTN